MKKFISLIIALLAGFTVSASHLAGAEIGYEYISTNSNGSHQYKVRLQVYRDISGIPLNLNQSICVKSSCFADQTIALTFVPSLPQNGGNVRQALPVPDLAACVNLNDPDMVEMEIYFFEATVTLQGNCPDWKFTWHDNARNTGAIDNLNFTGTNADLYVEALLNNTVGQNTSPTFVNPAAKGFCVGSPFTWSQAATEPDNDSLYYEFGIPLVSPAAPVCVTPSPANFAAGYTQQQPMTTATGITINHKTGTFYFTPSQIETDVVNVIVIEYRQDPSTGLWLMIGNTVRDLQIPIIGQCLQATAAGPKIDASASGFSQENVDADSIRDYLKGLGFTKAIFDSTTNPVAFSMSVIDYSCGDSVIPLKFNNDIVCSSISDNGTEFRLIGPDSSYTPIPAVSYTCQPDLTTNDIALLLHQPLDINGDYYLQIKNGDDGNTLQNECGFSLTPFYTMKIRVSGCKTPVYNLDNVTVVRDSSIQIDWSAIDTTLNKKLFTSWVVLKSVNNQFWVVDNIYNINARSYTDLTSGPEEVDAYKYNYAVQLVENYTYLTPSNVINSILLEYETGADQAEFTWNSYDGWNDPQYRFEYSKTEPNQTWQSLAGPSASLTDYIYNYPEETQMNAGTYAFRVIATNPNGTSAYESESNWLYLEFTHIPENNDDPYVSDIPNIFTPNGDSRNDKFHIDNNTYSHLSLSVYNRWGQLVFEDIDAPREKYMKGNGWDATNQNSGKQLADGVYYYLISFSDNTSGKTQEAKGPVTILRGTD